MIAYFEREFEWMRENLLGLWCPSFSGATHQNLPDISGNNNLGRLINFDRNLAWKTDGVKIGLDFDGLNDQVLFDRGLQIPINTTYTVTAWIKKTVLGVAGRNGGIFRGSNTFLVTGETSGRLWARHNNINIASDASGPVLLNAGWCHVGLSWDGVRANLIFNGVVAFSVATTSSEAFTISALGFQGTNFLLGELDDVRIFNRALTPQQIRNQYLANRGGGILHEPPKRRAFFVPAAPLPGPVRRRSSRFLGFPG